MSTIRRQHREMESAFGVRVGDCVQRGDGYGSGIVQRIADGYVHGSGIRAKVRRDPDELEYERRRWPNTSAIVMWDVRNLQVVTPAPGPRVDGAPENAALYLPPPVPEDIAARLRYDLQELRKRVGHLERIEDRRRRDIRHLARLVEYVAVRIEREKSPATTAQALRRVAVGLRLTADNQQDVTLP